MSDNEVVNWWKKKKFPQKLSKENIAKWSFDCACCDTFLEQGQDFYYVGEYKDSDKICWNCKNILSYYFEHGNGD